MSAVSGNGSPPWGVRGFEQRATDALVGYVGGQAMLRLNLRDAVALSRQIEAERLAGERGCEP